MRLGYLSRHEKNLFESRYVNTHTHTQTYIHIRVYVRLNYWRQKNMFGVNTTTRHRIAMVTLEVTVTYDDDDVGHRSRDANEKSHV